jgi:hypothetical protein
VEGFLATLIPLLLLVILGLNQAEPVQLFIKSPVTEELLQSNPAKAGWGFVPPEVKVIVAVARKVPILETSSIIVVVPAIFFI